MERYLDTYILKIHFAYINIRIHDKFPVPSSYVTPLDVICTYICTSSKWSQARERFGRLRRHWKAQWDEKLMKCRWGRKDISSGNGNGGRQSAAVCVRKLERWKIENTKKIKKINKYNGIIPEHTNTSNTMWDANIFVAFGWKILFS